VGAAAVCCIAMERYELVIPRPLHLRQLRKRPARRPRAPDALEAILRAESALLYDAAIARGFVAPPEAVDDDLSGGPAEVGADGAPEGAADSGAELMREGDGDGGREGKTGGALETGVEEGDERERDLRTDAERRFAATAAAREDERIARVASVSYKEQVDRFNKGLAGEPQHYDVFKTSHTKG
jgi:hypothetical protein